IDDAESVRAEAEYLLRQLEIPLEVVEYAITKASGMGVKVILNPAPAAKIAPEALSRLYAITPNETECSLLTGIEIETEADAMNAADALHALGIPNVVITCGKRGALISTADERVMVPARKVEAVDTTAAGDVFNGALTVGLAEGKTMVEAARMATCASAIAVTRIGAQSSIPTRCEVEAMLGD
ncbi:MAG: bifunctional hydroxymethylpyrimidine kinase/phosphomethylpyrimidine kinase, partial [Muribaculaceae bacterium]|nr:bifunctional hydroxymethylpyrimidine kinase/phosphomethylpyrimidine kinase [Muribaculaceae bacterium]